MPRVLITGATGFIGSQLVRSLELGDYTVRAAVRSPACAFSSRVEVFECGDISADTVWDACLAEVDIVVHLAGRVHIMDRESASDDAAFIDANTVATTHLLKCAAESSVKRFIYLSSVKVNGEENTSRPFDETMAPQPEDAYAKSKLAAEKALLEFSGKNEIEVVVIRPPLVYGPGAKGNFAALTRAISKGMPFPLQAVKNRRSMVSVFNLCDLIKLCLEHPAAAGQIFLVSDGEDVSTPDLIRLLSAALGRKPRLFPVPVFALKLAAALTGRVGLMRRLCGNLQVDIGKARQVLGWNPPLSLEEGIRRSV